MARATTLLMTCLLSAGAAFAQTATPTEESIQQVMLRVYAYLRTTAVIRPINGDTGAAVTLDNLPRNVALDRTTLRINTYESGVTYSGLLLAYKYTGTPRYRAHVNNIAALALMSQHMRTNYPTATFETFPNSVTGRTYSMRPMIFPQSLDDSGSMCAAMIKAERAGMTRLEPWIENYVNWVSTRQFRLADGTFARNTPMPNTLWVDDLYMSVPCLAQMAKRTGDRRYFDDAAKQILQFHSRMFVPAKGLWMHGWVQEMSPHPAFHWGRGNGWAFMATAELLSVLPKDHPARPRLLEIFRAHAEGLRRVQASSGLWHQLLDRPDSYEETSSSAMFVFGMARGINLGWLSRGTYTPVVLRGWNGLTTKVNSLGQVEGTCVGTGLGWDDTFYLNRPTDVNATLGYGPVFHAGAEVLFMLQKFPESTLP
jgi:unsaturated rhamnogalacturonyl hydrolase